MRVSLNGSIQTTLHYIWSDDGITSPQRSLFSSSNASLRTHLVQFERILRRQAPARRRLRSKLQTFSRRESLELFPHRALVVSAIEQRTHQRRRLGGVEVEHHGLHGPDRRG